MVEYTPNIIQKNIKTLIAAEYNPRQLTKEQYKHLSDSLKRFGVVDPILINKNKDRKNIIIGGHQRVKVATDLGLKEIPCIELDLTLDQEKELNVRLNKNVGEWDMDILSNLFDVDELLEWGFSTTELDLDIHEDPKDISESITEQFEVVIECSGEVEQEEVFNKVTKLGYKCRILTL